MFVGSLPINIESKHEALGPSLARGKSEVSQLCAGAFARRSSLNSDRQGSLNAPTPNLGFWILLDHVKPFSFLLFIFSNQQLLNCFAKIPLSNYIPLSLCNKSTVFSEMHQIRQWPFQPTAKKGDKFSHKSKPYGIPSLKSPGRRCLPSTTYQLPKLGTNHPSSPSPFLSAEPSRHHEMQSPRLLANLWLQFCLKLWWTKSLILKPSLDPFKSVTFCKPIPP